LLGMMFLWAPSVVGQIATGIRLVDVQFSGDTQEEVVYLRQCAADLKSRIYEGPEWLDHVTERVRELCLQENGYYKAVVKSSARQLPDKDDTHQFVITFDLDVGPQYRTGRFDFTNNRVFSAEELRSMFDLASGDIFRPAKIRQGIARMRDAYIAREYPNFTPVPDTSIDDSRSVINVAIYVDEGEHTPPEKVLFEKAMAAWQAKRYTVANLTFQTLLNTYPNSEYARKARLALEDPRIAGCGQPWSPPECNGGSANDTVR